MWSWHSKKRQHYITISSTFTISWGENEHVFAVFQRPTLNELYKKVTSAFALLFIVLLLFSVIFFLFSERNPVCVGLEQVH